MDLSEQGWYYVYPAQNAASLSSDQVTVVTLGLGKVGYDITLFAGDPGIMFYKGKIEPGVATMHHAIAAVMFRKKEALEHYIKTLQHLDANWDDFQSRLGQSLASMPAQGNA